MSMDYERYFAVLKEAAQDMGKRGLPWADQAGVVNLTLTFMRTEVDDDEDTDITMTKSFTAVIIQLTDNTWQIDDVEDREVTTEVNR